MNEVLFILIMMLGIFIQAVTGFGGTLIAMPLGIAVMGISTTKPVLTVLVWITAVAVAAVRFKKINFKELFKMVAVMMAGVIAGLWVSGKYDLKILMLIYAVTVVFIGIKKLFFDRKIHPTPLIQNISLGVAGIMQGLFVSGGSFLAVYAVEKLPEKQNFRATVNAVWAIIDTFMIISYFISGDMSTQVLTLSGISVIPTVAVTLLGAWVAKKVNQQTFLKIVYGLLIVSGIVLFITYI